MTDRDANPVWGEGWPAIRDLWALDPRVIHLNHGSFGAVPLPVQLRQQTWQDRMNANPMGFFSRELADEVERARLICAEFLGAEPAGFAFVNNSTTGASAVVASLPLHAGAQVLVTDHGYGAVIYAVTRACHDAGAELVTVPIPLDTPVDTIEAAILDRVTERTALAVIDHISSPTARRFPVERLVPALRDRAVPVLVDGAHAPGMVPVDLDALEPDFWIGNFHKWVCAPRGSAGLWVAPQWRRTMRSLVVSWRESEGYPFSFSMIGTVDHSPWLTTPEALALMNRLGWEQVRQHNVALVGYGQRIVAEALGLDPDRLVVEPALSMRPLTLPAGVAETKPDADALMRRIATELQVETSISPWNGVGLLRLSAQLYNCPADYERLACGLPPLLGIG
ncbi:MAG: aminotransferase class V-fold PLP-dependent enzyme [Actinomycetes bacterium]